jgi:hypothetical protein
MKIAIVSDTHNNMATLKKAIDWIKKENIRLILHCGDISSQETIDEAKKYFGGEIKFVRGNAESDMAGVPDTLELEIDGKRLFLVHYPNEAKKMAQSGKYDLVFYGHTHRPWDERVGDCHMINPGELAGQFYRPTFAVYNTNTEKLELKILEKL